MKISTVVRNIRSIPDIKDAFLYYIKFLPKKMDQFQIDDWIWIIEQSDQVCVVASLGGSKTEDMICLYVFFGVMGYKPLWLATTTGQLKQAKEYLSENPFFGRIYDGTDVIFKCCNKTGYFGPLTKSFLGGRYDICFLDEEQTIEEAQEYYYDNILGRMTQSPLHKMIHIGSLKDGTKFVENTHIYPTLRRPWRKCPWLVKGGLIQKLIDDPHYPRDKINMYYECIEDVPGGVIFPKIEMRNEKCTLEATSGGIDTNSTDGYVVSTTTIIKNDYHIISDRIFDKRAFNELADYLKEKDIDFIIEMDGQGAMLYNILTSMNVTNLKRFWSKDGKSTKIESLATYNIICYDQDVYKDFKRQKFVKGKIHKYDDCHLFDAAWISYKLPHWYPSA